jgi:hypothetical protein
MRGSVGAVRLIFVLALLSSCKTDKERDDVVRPPRNVPGDATTDTAAADAAIDAMSERDALALRLRAYVELLSIDFWAYQYIAEFPGVPPGTTFVASSFHWDTWPTMQGDDVQAKLVAIAQAANRRPRVAADEVVQPYAQALATWLPKLRDLQNYYNESRFVDDEFDRGRRDSADVERARRELAALRVPMRAAVLTSWRELSADVPDSPRAIVGAAWEACVRFADHLMAGESPEALTAAVSACRRAIPTVSALPAGNGGDLAIELRVAAIAIGDQMANRYMNHDPPAALARLTTAYLDAWPKLSTAPAERGPP